MPATYDDASVIVQLLRWGTELGIEEAGETVFSDGFDGEQASFAEPAVRKMLQFAEVIGTFVKQGILDRELVLDLWWMEGIWDRLGPAVRRERVRLRQPRLYENIEVLVAPDASVTPLALRRPDGPPIRP